MKSHEDMFTEYILTITYKIKNGIIESNKCDRLVNKLLEWDIVRQERGLK